MEKESTNEFDIKAFTWDDNPLNIERAKVIADKIRKQINFNPSMTGFEFGCGTGLLSIYLQLFLKSITLADSSDGMLQVLKQKILKQQITNMKVVKTDHTLVEIPGEKYDIIYTMMTIHHIPNVNEILMKFKGMLKVSGSLAIVDLEKEDGSFHDGSFMGHQGFDIKEMKQLFEANGFKKVRSENCYEIVRKDESGKEKRYPLFLMVGEK
jgi:2-polyprenyl-3-methyl-5-hydroxy-6-metoxy-1,4-benzoquinol methylase